MSLKRLQNCDNIRTEGGGKDMKEYVCTVCGYVHKGELPEDFVCPVCRHPASDFEKVIG